MNSGRHPLLKALLVAVTALATGAAAHQARAGSGDARSGHYRVIAGSDASVAGSATSSAHRTYVVGGSGAAIGIAASDKTSIVAGNSTIEPPERIFRSDFETAP
ncbi:MAG TPA: hypothetical protein VN720_02065 [Rudaea sp.]|nr:hypothetical protein [Rudaea sp.]